MADPWLDDYDRQRDEAYRAIGRYVAEFSELVRLMRDIVCEYVAKSVVDMHISSMLLGEATPQVIANAFFGMCRTMGELDDDEQKVASALRREVKEAIETRNDVAHGDWSIGRVKLDEHGQLQTMPPRLIRILPARSEGPQKTLDLTVKDIDALADRVERLLGTVEDFGRLALKLPVFERDRPDGRVVNKGGEYRISDVLRVTGGKRDAAIRIVRDGPRAEAVFGGSYSASAHDSRAMRSASE